jgi:hypothetical protein
MRYISPQIEDTNETAFTERIELAEIRNEKGSAFLVDLYGQKFDFSRRLFIATSRHDHKFATYYHLDDDGNFVRAKNLNDA